MNGRDRMVGHELSSARKVERGAAGMHGPRWGSGRNIRITFDAAASAIYGAVPDEIRAQLAPQWRGDLKRSKSPNGSASPLTRVLEQVDAIERAATIAENWNAGAFTEAVCAAIRSVGTRHISDEQLDLKQIILQSQSADVEEDVRECAAMQTDFTNRDAVHRLADAKSRSGLAEFRAATALRAHAETLPR